MPELRTPSPPVSAARPLTATARTTAGGTQTGPTSHVLLGSLVVLGAATLFGMLGPLSRFAYDLGIQPPAFVAWRAAIGLVTLGLVIGWRVRTGRSTLLAFRSLPRRVRVALLTAALMGFLLNLGMFIAFDRITVALALLGFYTYPAMVALVNVVSGREPFDRARVTALALALAGMAAVVVSQLDPAAGIRIDAIGVGLALGAALSQTVYVTVSRDGYGQVPTEQAIFLVLLVTTVGATLLAIATAGPTSLVAPILDPNAIPLLLFTGTFAAAIPSLGFLGGIRAIGGLRAGILMLWEPVVGVALAAWLLAEAIVPIQVLGAGAILAAAVILQRAAAREAHGTHAGSGDVEDERMVVPAGS